MSVQPSQELPKIWVEANARNPIEKFLAQQCQAPKIQSEYMPRTAAAVSDELKPMDPEFGRREHSEGEFSDDNSPPQEPGTSAHRFRKQRLVQIVAQMKSACSTESPSTEKGNGVDNPADAAPALSAPLPDQSRQQAALKTSIPSYMANFVAFPSDKKA